MELIDFSNCKVDPHCMYSGANGKKFGVIYNNQTYMLKVASKGKTTEQDYSNSVFSEYISCHILETLGFNVQETILGKYNYNNKEKLVCACKDFEKENTKEVCKLQEFAKLKNSVLLDSPGNGYGTDINEVIETLKEQKLLPENELINFFWDMFIADSLLGNFDRHNGNWGFLTNNKTKEVSIAPIFDCGSCLYPQLPNNQLEYILKKPEEIEKRIYVFPNSALREGERKINYYEYINSLRNQDCNEALKRIYPKIDLIKIYEIIDNTLGITDIQKEFYKTMLQKRYELILTPAYEKIIKQEKINGKELVWENDNTHYENGEIVKDQDPILNTEEAENSKNNSPKSMSSTNFWQEYENNPKEYLGKEVYVLGFDHEGIQQDYDVYFDREEAEIIYNIRVSKNISKDDSYTLDKCIVREYELETLEHLKDSYSSINTEEDEEDEEEM